MVWWCLEQLLQLKIKKYINLTLFTSLLEFAKIKWGLRLFWEVTHLHPKEKPNGKERQFLFFRCSRTRNRISKRREKKRPYNVEKWRPILTYEYLTAIIPVVISKKCPSGKNPPRIAGRRMVELRFLRKIWFRKLLPGCNYRLHRTDWWGLRLDWLLVVIDTLQLLI